MAASANDGREVAIKILRDDVDDPDARERFRGEATVLAGQDLPQVVPVRGIVCEGERLGLVMDLLTGPNLRQVLDQQGTLPAGEVCRFAARRWRWVSPRHTPRASCTVT